MAAKTDGCGRVGVRWEEGRGEVGGGGVGIPTGKALNTSPPNSLYIIKTCPGHRREEQVIECRVRFKTLQESEFRSVCSEDCLR